MAVGTTGAQPQTAKALGLTNSILTSPPRRRYDRVRQHEYGITLTARSETRCSIIGHVPIAHVLTALCLHVRRSDLFCSTSDRHLGVLVTHCAPRRTTMQRKPGNSKSFDFSHIPFGQATRSHFDAANAICHGANGIRAGYSKVSGRGCGGRTQAARSTSAA